MGLQYTLKELFRLIHPNQPGIRLGEEHASGTQLLSGWACTFISREVQSLHG